MYVILLLIHKLEVSINILKIKHFKRSYTYTGYVKLNNRDYYYKETLVYKPDQEFFDHLQTIFCPCIYVFNYKNGSKVGYSDNIYKRVSTVYAKPWAQQMEYLYIIELPNFYKSNVINTESKIKNYYKNDMNTRRSNEFIDSHISFKKICSKVRWYCCKELKGSFYKDLEFKNCKPSNLMSFPYLEDNHADNYYSPYGRNYDLIKQREAKAKRFRDKVKARRESDEF